MRSNRLAPAAPAERPLALDIAHGPDHQRTIEQSHLRCVAMGLSEAAVPELSPTTARGARQLREQHQRLFEHATPVMEMLFEQIVFTKSIVALTDTQGNVLQTVGDPGFLERAQQVALSPGVNWSEAAKGTNAVGTALFTEAPTLVHAGEHFLRAHHFLTCSASPIFDHAGQLMGVLDVSGHWNSYHPHTLAMVSMSARMIENQWFHDKFRHGLQLHFHSRPELLGTLREGLIAIGPDGAILGANRSAIEQLGLNVPALRMLGLDAVFDIRLGQIADHCRRGSDEPLRLVPQHGAAQGQVLFARAVFNWPTMWPAVSLATGTGLPPDGGPASLTSPEARPPLDDGSHRLGTTPTTTPVIPSTFIGATLEAQELAAIRRAVDAAGGNISRAARQLGVSRNTVYRKLRAAAS